MGNNASPYTAACVSRSCLHSQVFALGLIFQVMGKADKAVKSGKAAGMDEQALEYWKVVLDSVNGNSEGAEFLLDFCNAVWTSRSVPDSWHLQRVALIYKKGDPSECGNYRPICLLNSAYKIFAMILFRIIHNSAPFSFGTPDFFLT